ncbi:hypothetical protein M9Y10_028312 [Tritrichomonas musculus]|uniref:Ankyrin repeat protein n=1 Tax=Tritrichomonas musculus TaxID=1915356 RepID=A0ABR2KKZ8_9EUKA
MSDDREAVAFILNHIDTDVNAMALSLPIDYDFGRKIYRNVYPIHMACHFGSNRLFDLIKVQPGVRINVQDDCNRSILHYSFKNCQYDVYRQVLKFPRFNCKEDKCGYDGYPIHIVCQINNLKGCQFLLSQPMIQLDDPVDDKRNKDDYGKTPILIASARGYGEIVKAILDHGLVDFNYRLSTTGESTLLNLCFYGLDDALYVLMNKKGFSMRNQKYKDDSTPLILATNASSVKSVQMLLDYGFYEINAIEKVLKRTALMLACKKGCSDIVELLLKVPGIDYNRGDISGMTALHFACRKGDTRCVELLLKMPEINVNAIAVSFFILFLNNVLICLFKLSCFEFFFLKTGSKIGDDTYLLSVSFLLF